MCLRVWCKNAVLFALFGGVYLEESILNFESTLQPLPVSETQVQCVNA